VCGQCDYASHASSAPMRCNLQQGPDFVRPLSAKEITREFSRIIYHIYRIASRDDLSFLNAQS
jgi:hypothetical protein